MFLSHLLKEQKPALILGAGRSGIAAAKLLAQHSFKSFIYDDKKKWKNICHHFDQKEEFLCATISYKDILTRIKDFSFMVLSPGIGQCHSLVKLFLDQGLNVISEVELGLFFASGCKVIGITGTNGKSTTTAMLSQVLCSAGYKAIACGNIGRPLCDLITCESLAKLDFIVLELSSFQLETTISSRLDLGIILNITPDHLDRYHSYFEYERAKLKIIDLLKSPKALIISNDLKKKLPLQQKVHVICRNDGNPYQDDLLRAMMMQGQHNLQNAQTVILAARHLGLNEDQIYHGLLNFIPLPHRCEIVSCINDITFVNDSKGTTIEAVKAALSMSSSPTHLLLGGQDKGEDFSSLGNEKYSHVKGFYIYGQAQEKIFSEIKSFKSIRCNNLQGAFSCAFNNAKPHERILLSPGCASFDEFENFEQRGEAFRALVKSLSPHHPD